MTIIHVVNDTHELYLAWTAASIVEVEEGFLYSPTELSTYKISDVHNIELLNGDNDGSEYCIQLPKYSEEANFAISFPIKILFQTTDQAEKCISLLSAKLMNATVNGTWNTRNGNEVDFENRLVCLPLNSFSVQTQALDLFSVLDKIESLPYQVRSYICKNYFGFDLDVLYKKELKGIIFDGLDTTSKITILKDQSFWEACRTADASRSIELFIFLGEQCERLNLIREATLLRIEILARKEKSKSYKIISDEQCRIAHFKIAEALYGGGCAFHSEDVAHMLKAGIGLEETEQSEGKDDKETKVIQESLIATKKDEEIKDKKDAVTSLDPDDEQPAHKNFTMHDEVQKLDDKKRLRFIMELFAKASPLEEARYLHRRVFLELAGGMLNASLKSLDLCDIAEFLAEQNAKIQNPELDKKTSSDKVTLQVVTPTQSSTRAVGTPITNAFNLTSSLPTSDSNNSAPVIVPWSANSSSRSSNSTKKTRIKT